MKRWFASRMMVYIYVCTAAAFGLTVWLKDAVPFVTIASLGIGFGQAKNIHDRHVESLSNAQESAMED